MQYIGKELRMRMEILGLSISELAEKTFLEEKEVEDIINDKYKLNEIDEFDLELICSAIHCKPDFFTNVLVKKRDLLIGTQNRGKDNKKAIDVKAKIQDYINDFEFINEIQ